MTQKRIFRQIAAVAVLCSLFLILFLSLVIQSNGGDYTVGQADGIVHDQVQQITQCVTAEKSDVFLQLPDYLVPAMAFAAVVFLLIFLTSEGKSLSGYTQNTLVSLCVRIND